MSILRLTPFHALRQFETAGCTRDLPPVLLVPPLSGDFPMILRDMVLALLPRHRVVVIDWANLRHVPLEHGTFGFESNIRAITEAVLQIGPAVHVVALCQGGVPALAAAAHLAARLPGSEPRGLALIAAPIDPDANPTRLVEMIRARAPRWYRTVPVARVSRDYGGHRRWVYPAETQLAALERYLEATRDGDTDLARKMRCDDGADPSHFPFRDLYTSVMDLDARHYAENIERVFLSPALPRGALSFAGRPVSPAALTGTRLLTIEGDEDQIAAPGQTSASHALCTGLAPQLKEHLALPGCGHFALFHGATWRETVHPELAAWLSGAGRHVFQATHSPAQRRHDPSSDTQSPKG